MRPGALVRAPEAGVRRQATFAEWNLLSIFLLIPLALSLWRWPRDAHSRRLTASLGAVVFGLAFSP